MTRRFVFVLCLSSVFSSLAFGQVVRTWVSSTGSDAAACSRAAPCRNFSAAITAVDIGGEVVVIDSAGYGPVIITKEVSIIAPQGVHAAIAPTTGAAITMNAGLTGSVLLRNLFLNSQGAVDGIVHLGANFLFIDHCEISGFSAVGVNVSPSSAIYFSVSSSAIRKCNVGIRLQGLTNSAGEISGSRIESHSEVGILAAQASKLTVRDSVVADSVTGCMVVSPAAAMDVIDSAVFNCGTGFYAIGLGGGPVNMNLEHCLVSTNGVGLRTEIIVAGTAVIRVANSMITNNQTGLFSGLGGTVESRGDNTLEGNTTENTFSSSYVAK